MFWWWIRERYTAEAQALVDGAGEGAYYDCRALERAARGRRDRAAALHWSRVARRVSELTGKVTGLDTATRMLRDGEKENL